MQSQSETERPFGRSVQSIVNKIWFRKHVEHFWAEGTCPANSPNLSLMENILSTIKKT